MHQASLVPARTASHSLPAWRQQSRHLSQSSCHCGVLWVWFQHLPTLQASFVETSFKSSLNIAVLQTAFKNLCGVFYRQRFGKSMKMGARAQKGLRPSKSCINKNSAKNIKESHAFQATCLAFCLLQAYGSSKTATYGNRHFMVHLIISLWL